VAFQPGLSLFAGCTGGIVQKQHRLSPFSFQYTSKRRNAQEEKPRVSGAFYLPVDPVDEFAVAGHILDDVFHKQITSKVACVSG
jgi:hypothetical protein